MVGGGHHHGGLGVARPDPVGGQQHRGRGAAVGGLEQHPRIAPLAQGARDVGGMAPHRHDHRVLRASERRESIDGLLQQRPGVEQRHVLLGTLIAGDLPDERPQPDPFAPRQDDTPERALATHGVDTRHRLGSREMVAGHPYPPRMRARIREGVSRPPPCQRHCKGKNHAEPVRAEKYPTCRRVERRPVPAARGQAARFRSAPFGIAAAACDIAPPVVGHDHAARGKRWILQCSRACARHGAFLAPMVRSRATPSGWWGRPRRDGRWPSSSSRISSSRARAS